jgi:hypothetical protein
MTDNNNMGYHQGNSSPLRTYSPKRGGQETHTSYNVTQVKSQTHQQVAGHQSSSAQMVVSHSHSYGAGGNCAGAPTEKERMIAQLMKEAGELRTRERDYKVLQDQLMNLEQNFGRINEDKRRMDEDYKSRVDANIRFI